MSDIDSSSQDTASFPEAAVRQILARFGIDHSIELEPWPYGESDLLARFWLDGVAHLVKGRHIEQRGARSLFETQRLQRELLANGLPVPALLAAPSGATLIESPDREWHYCEIQRQVPGVHLTGTAENLRRAGELIAQFHSIGAEIDTYLLNKSTYIGVFRQRGYQATQQFHAQLLAAAKTGAEQRRLNVFFARTQDPALRDFFDWRIVHGDLSSENFLIDGDNLYMIDWDEVGLGPKAADHGDILGGLPGVGEKEVRALLEGYGQGGGQLAAPELESIYNGLVRRALQRWLAEGQGTDVEVVLAAWDFVLLY
ncbi:MAG: phosphotransferase [Candidatus Latescibacteria bacterium]|nr:phosphotransferase [Candidatus Latescibacterota bacterium]